MSVNPGSLAAQAPERDPATAMARRARDAQRAATEQAAGRMLQAAQFGAGGILVNGGGSITIRDGGSLSVLGSGSINVPSGGLNSAGSISAATTVAAGTAITAGTTITAGGIVSGSALSTPGSVSGNSGTFNGGLFSTAVYSTVVSGTRTATWTQIDGTVGTAPSSIRFKTNVVDAVFDETRMQAILNMSLKYYNYKAEIARRDDLNSPDYVGPEYHVHQEFGAIAEDLHTAGLWEFVVYERELDGQAKLDANGNVIPFAINYDLLSLAGIAVTRYLWAKQQLMASDIAAIKAHLGL